MQQDEYEDNFGSWRKWPSLTRSRTGGATLAELAYESSEDSSSSDSSDDGCCGAGKAQFCDGLRQRHPTLYEWVMARVGGPLDIVIVLVFIATDAGSFALDEAVWLSRVNATSVVVVTNFSSLVLSVTVTCLFEGGVVKGLLDVQVLWRFLVAAVLFQTAWRLDTDAYMAGTAPIVVKTLGYAYLPLSAVASWVLFRRGYGSLEWLALLMMTLAMGAFTQLRERCRAGDCTTVYQWPNHLGTFLVLGGVFLSCTASLLCERLFKGQSYGLQNLKADRASKIPYFVHKVHLDLCGLFVALVVWCSPVHLSKSILGVQSQRGWFGEWGPLNFVYVPVHVLNWWMAGLIAKHYSTVTKALIQTVATGLVVLLEDPLLASNLFSQVMMPSVCMFIIIILSAIIFQTGRINLAIESAYFAKDKVMKVSVGLKKALKDVSNLPGKIRHGKGGATFSIKDLTVKYMIIILYTLADATRTLLYTQSVGNSMVTPQSFAVAMNLAMLCLSNLILFMKPPEGRTGREAVVEAWQWRKLLKFAPCGVLFALTSALMSMAMGIGISGSMSVVIGKIYLPICAVASRFLLGKYYMWLEWFAIIILTLDSAAFGFLRSMGAGGRATSGTAVLACMGSATSSALSAMLMEKVMKSEEGGFMMQKLRTDAACLFWSVMFLPIMGYLADPRHFPKGAYWLYRPATVSCNDAGACGSWANDTFHSWDGGGTFAYYGSNDTFTHSPGLGGDLASEGLCSCVRGVFCCWSFYLIYVMLAVSVFYGFITGLVVTKFGGVLRAVADNFSLLLVYTVGDPLVNGTNLTDVSLNLTAIILPLSSQTFSQAAEELKKAQEAKELHRDEDEEAREGDVLILTSSSSDDEAE